MPVHTTPTRDAITGREDQGDLTQPQQALAQFYKALNSRDIALMEQNWDGGAEAVMDSPLGGIKRGWADIQATYQRLFDTKAAFSFEFWDYTLHRNGDVFWAVGRERGRWIAEQETFELAVRTTRIFRKTEERWRQVHHHGSIEDPAMLARYQAAVRGKSEGDAG
jgi:SnoaL-like protein